jgi:hypothetical protein
MKDESWIIVVYMTLRGDLWDRVANQSHGNISDTSSFDLAWRRGKIQRT